MDRAQRACRYAVLIALLSSHTLLLRADENKLFTPDYFRRVGGDLWSVPGSIAHWGPRQWALAGGVLAATYGLYTYDAETRAHFGQERHDSLSDISKSLTHWGDYHYLGPAIAATWIAGLVTGSSVMNKVAGDAAESTFIAAGIINPTIALATGRALPSAGESPSRFLPFRRHRYSFPSGHTSAAFAAASAIDVDLRETFGYWQTPILYGVAGLVGISRVYDHKHYPSEVFLGAAIGTTVGRWVSSKARNRKRTVTAFLTPSTVGLTWRFGPGGLDPLPPSEDGELDR